MSKVYGGLVSSPYNKLDTNNGYGVTHTFGGNVVNGGHEEPATITLTTFPESIGAVSGDGIFFKGSSVTVVATPDSESEYPEFDGWYEGETKVSENASYTFTVSGSKTLTAKFKEVTPSLFIRKFDGTYNILVDSKGRVALIADDNGTLCGVNGNSYSGINRLFAVMPSQMQAAIISAYGSAEYPSINTHSTGEQTIVVNGYTYTATVEEDSRFTLSPAVEMYN